MRARAAFIPSPPDDDVLRSPTEYVRTYVRMVCTKNVSSLCSFVRESQVF
jgi:hypothetical protein